MNRSFTGPLFLSMLLAGAAQAQLQVYGTVDVGAGRLSNQNPGPPTTGVSTITGVHNGGLQTSYIGFRGTEDLGDGMFARFQIEGFMRVDLGQPGRFDASPGSGADPHWSRISFVGVGGRWGEVRLGNNGTPLWISMLQTNALGANSVFSPSFRQLYNGGTRGRSDIDTAMVNSAAYLSPNLGGVTAQLVVQFREGRSSGNNIGANIAWRSGPVHVAAAMQRARHLAPPDLAAPADQDMLLIGGSYNFGVVRAFGQYTTVDNVTNKSKLPHFGVILTVGPLAQVQLSSGEDKNKVAATGVTTKRRTTSLGYVYTMSKRTDLYAFAMNERFPVAGPARSSGSSLVGGIRHTF